MAAALAYRTLFSLVPMAVLGLLVLRAFVSIDDAQQWFQRSAYEFLGWSAIAMPTGKDAPAGATPAPPSKPHAEPGGARQPASADQVFDRFVQRAWQLRFGSIGFVGLLVLIWAALSLVVTSNSPCLLIANVAIVFRSSYRLVEMSSWMRENWKPRMVPIVPRAETMPERMKPRPASRRGPSQV